MGWELKAVNALSNYFRVESVRETKGRRVSAGNLVLEEDIIDTTKKEPK
jgi:topoisomerase-4 subunit B